MGKSDDAYEHKSDMTGFGSAGEGGKANEHREAAIPPTDRNEVDIEERNRPLSEKHGPETHQDTRITKKGEE